MKPCLVTLSGPLAGRALPVGDRLALGRHRDNNIRLTEAAASRHHAAVTTSPEGLSVTDLGSRHGTFVNGVPVTSRLLGHGDRLTLAGAEFLVLLDDEGPGPEGSPPAPVFLAESTLEHPASSLLAAHPARALLELARELQARRPLPELCEHLLAAALEMAPATRAALLLAEPEGGDLRLAASRDPWGPCAPFPIAEPLARRALAEGTVITAGTTDLPAGGSQLLLPLTGAGGPQGLLFLEFSGVSPTRPAELEAIAGLAALGALALERAREVAWLTEEAARLRRSATAALWPVGESPAWLTAMNRLERAAPTPSTVLLTGESGTGKELAARFLHRASPRAAQPFVAVNCAVLSGELLASELFGHERGAFTGALSRRLGAFEEAHRGTLFLDEIAELAPPLQAKLLRALQEREVVRLGSNEARKVDVRVVAATHQDLARAVANGSFREDLFYRLNVIAVALPPLRERGEDVQLLASFFVQELGRRLGRPRVGFTKAARACLARYRWPGNVRELGNAIERALVLGEGDLIRAEDLPESLLDAVGGTGGESSPLPAFHQAVRALKERLILDAVSTAGGNITRAAEALGLNANYLHRLITNLALRPRLVTLSEERGESLSEG